MKRKFLTLSLLLLFSVQNASASKSDFILYDRILPAFSEPKQDNIYCDTVNHWCNFSATRLYNEDIFTGIKIGEKYYFMPEEYITRGEFLLYMDAVLKTPSAENTVLPFKDVASIPHWQISTVQSMYKLGYISGKLEKSNLFFNHDEKISRLECAIILNNILGLKNSAQSTEYYDNYLIPKHAVTAIKNVSDYGLMTGYEDKSFRPYVKITRAMLADILCRVKDYFQTQK